jgi:hypothetical protein
MGQAILSHLLSFRFLAGAVVGKAWVAMNPQRDHRDHKVLHSHFHSFRFLAGAVVEEPWEAMWN